MEKTRPTFNNKHNTVYRTDDGTKWDSRACAVVAHVLLVKNGETFVLLGKRGNVTDHPGKWNIPCGYLDWNENLEGAMKREVWEETGFDLDAFHGPKVYSMMSQPWLVYSEPSENRENVAMHMGVVIDMLGDMLPELCLDNMEEGESTGAYWMHYDSALQIPEHEWAFSHHARLRQFRDEVLHVIAKCKR